MQLRIVPHEPRHAPLQFEAIRESVREIAPWMPWCHPGYSIAEAEHFTQSMIEARGNETAYDFVIESPDGRVLGGCGLNQIDRENRRCNLGYWVRSSETGRGAATRAVAELVAWAFRETDLVRLEILVAVENLASLRVAEKAGAVREGTLRSRLLLHGRHHDAVLHSIVASR